jgi:hypothetical protein
MPITIDYSPVAGLGALAGMAGQAEGQRAQQSADIASLQLTNQAQAEANRNYAQSKAFSLQQAMADKFAAGQLRTPAADHIAEKNDLANKDKAAAQTQFKTQLDDMLSSGQIDTSQYGKGLLAYMTGNHAMMAQIMAEPKVKADKPNISNAEEVEIIRQPFRERRRGLEEQMQQVTKGLADPIATTAGVANLKTQQTDLQQKIDALYDQEAIAIDQWRKGGRKGAATPSPEGSGSITLPTGQTVTAASMAAAPGGVGSMTTQRQPNASEQNIINILGGQGITLPSFQPKTTTTGQGVPLTPEVAQQLLQEAGGDKDKARQLARARGYVF